MTESLTFDQERALLELRRLLEDDISNEMYKDTILLTKFLTARDFNIKQAESMIRKNLRWKKEMQVDTILTDFKPREVFLKHTCISIIGFDKEGYLLRYIPIGGTDFIGIAKSANSILFLKYLLQKVHEDLEIHESQSKKLGKAVYQTINIYDAAHLSLSQIKHVPSIQVFLKFLITVQDNYPEISKKVYIINASTYFTTIWPVIQKCLGPSLKKKISVYGKDGWKEELLKIMNADDLPAFLGGNRTDPDGNPLCQTIVNHVQPVPEIYLLEKDITKFAGKSGVKFAKIDRQGCFLETIQVTDSNAIINWEFELKKYDIGFGLSLEISDGTTEELIPVHKISTELEPYFGMYRCTKSGEHVMIFDNSFSWFHGKEIYYRTWITNAERTNYNGLNG